ncbi:MAG: PadR family transcriptional regulator [Candidatus Kariarchaeaceae archaeon]|jgi:DNA-binding MarR family transcriptional regulator
MVFQRFTQLLYLFLALEVLISFWLKFYLISFGLIIMGLIALVFGLITNRISTPILHQWLGIRSILQRLLVNQNILPPYEDEDLYPLPPLLSAEIDVIQSVISIPKPEFVKEIRSIGVDGLLIAIFLLSQNPTFFSIKTIQEQLGIPISTVYRTLKKLEEKEYVETRYTFDEPSRSYYSITVEGESLVLQVYELIGGSYLPPLREVNE